MEDQTMYFDIILHAGNARFCSGEAISLAKEGKFIEAEEQLNVARDEIIEAHTCQSNLLHDFANGVEIPFSIILTHAQDHLANAQTFYDLAEEIVTLHKLIYELKKD